MKNRNIIIALGMVLLLFFVFGFTSTEQKTPIPISYIGNFSQPWGKSGLTAARLAVEEINGAGGIAGRSLNLLSSEGHLAS